MADIARLVAALELESSKFHKEIDRVNNTLNRFEKNAKRKFESVTSVFKKLAVGAAIVGGIRGLTREIGALIDEADHLGDLTSQVDISVESLSTLGKAAGQFGIEAGALEQGLVKLSNNIAQAATGNKNLAASFQEMGVAIRDSNGNLKGTEQVLADLADAFSVLPDGPLKTAKAIEIFGKSGAQLIPFLNEGSKGIQELQAQIRALGGEISSKFTKDADAFNDTVANLKTSFGGLGREIAEVALPLLTKLIDLMARGASVVRDFFDTTPQERIKELTRDIEVLQQKLAVTPDFMGGLFTGKLAAAKKELAELRSEGGLFKDLIPGLTNELKAAGVAAQENLASGLKAADDAGKAAADSAKRQAEEQRRAIESATESLASLNAGLRQQVETYGLGETAVLSYRLAVGDLSDEVALLGDSGHAFADSIIAQSQALDELNQAAEKNKQIQEAQRRESEEIVALQRELLPLTSGLDSATLEYAESVEKLNEAYDRAAITSAQFELGVQNAEKRLKDAESRVEKSSANSVVFAEEAAKGIQDAFADFFFDPFDKGLKGLLQNVQTTLNRIAAEIVASKLSDLIFGSKGGSSGGSTTGFLQNIGNFFAGLGGGGGGGESFPLASDFLAAGGPVYAGGSYVVGEDGPELFSPSSNGRIIPNDELGMGRSVVVNINVSAPNGRLSQESIDQVATRGGLAVRRAMARNS